MDLLVASWAIVIYLMSAYGWGWLLINRIYPDSRPRLASTAICGIGAWIFIGGLLNVARLANPAALDAILGLGLVFTAVFAVSFVRSNHVRSVRQLRECLRSAPVAGESRLTLLLSGAFVAAIFLFLVMTQMPAAAFNLFDDFHTYLPRPVRMLQTGSLGGNPFDVLGIDSLGAQAFMQSFFVSRLSISHINAFDAIFCFILGLWLLVEMQHRFRIHWTFLIASMATFIAIDPQYVNVSSLYSGSLMILAMVFVSIVAIDDMGGADRNRAFAGAAALALITASLVALKTTFVVFAAVYLATFLGCALYLSEHKRRMARAIAVALLAGVVLITPWILLSLPNYAAALRIGLAGNAIAAAGDGQNIDFITKFVYVFSPAKSSWGGNYLTYSLLVSLLALAGVVLLVRFAGSRNVAERRSMAAILAACIAATASYLVNVHLFDPQNGLRYSCPILIATAAVAVLLASGGGAWLRPAVGVGRPFAYAGGVVLLVTVVAMGGAFYDELISRVQRAYHHRTLLPFAAVASKEHQSYMAASLGERAALHVHALQQKVEKDFAILALVRTPFHFDFARNRVFNATDSTVLNPWLADFLLDDDPERARRYLRERGVRYVMFEHDGYGVTSDAEFEPYLESPFRMVRQTGERNLILRKILRHLARHSRLLVADAGIVVFDISKNPGSSD